jgi:hypothetical protein
MLGEDGFLGDAKTGQTDGALKSPFVTMGRKGKEAEPI